MSYLMHCLHFLTPRHVLSLCGEKMCRKVHSLHVLSSLRQQHYNLSFMFGLFSWVHLIVSSNLSRKFKTLLQDSFSWQPATSTQHHLQPEAELMPRLWIALKLIMGKLLQIRVTYFTFRKNDVANLYKKKFSGKKIKQKDEKIDL